MDTKKIKVMVIEDEELLLQAIIRKLNALDFETVSCTSAKQAMDYLTELNELPDAIWLDYYLEDINGLEFMQKLKNEPKYSRIPVVVVSNSAGEDKKNAMLALGVKAYLLKAENRLEDIAEIVRDVASGGDEKDEGK